MGSRLSTWRSRLGLTEGGAMNYPQEIKEWIAERARNSSSVTTTSSYQRRHRDASGRETTRSAESDMTTTSACGRQSLTAQPYPYIPIRFRVRDRTREAAALIDTGFDGMLAVPAALTGGLGSSDRTRRLRTTSGELVWVPAYDGYLELLSQLGPSRSSLFASATSISSG